MPDGGGLVELVREPQPEKPDRSRLLAYFLDPDRKPMPSPPANATFRAKRPKSQVLELKPDAEAAPARAGALVSEPFEDPGTIEGQLTANVGGKSIAVPVSIR